MAGSGDPAMVVAIPALFAGDKDAEGSGDPATTVAIPAPFSADRDAEGSGNPALVVAIPAPFAADKDAEGTGDPAATVASTADMEVALHAVTAAAEPHVDVQAAIAPLPSVFSTSSLELPPALG